MTQVMRPKVHKRKDGNGYDIRIGSVSITVYDNTKHIHVIGMVAAKGEEQMLCSASLRLVENWSLSETF